MDRRLPRPLDESAVFVLMQAGRFAFEWTAEAVEPFGLSVAQFAAMRVIGRLGAMSQAALAERLGVSEPVMVEVASGLERQGLARRRQHRRDGRSRVLSPTAAGREVLAEAVEEVEGVEGVCLGQLGPKLCRRLARLAPAPLSPVQEAFRRREPAFGTSWVATPRPG